MNPSCVPSVAARFVCIAKRAMFLCLALAAVSYFAAYVSLRNRGIREMRQHGFEGLLYDSIENIEKSRDLGTHHFRARLFAPLNVIDQQLFGCPGPILGIMFDLAQREKKLNH